MQKSLVSVHSHWQPKIRQLSSRSKNKARNSRRMEKVLRIFEAKKTGFRQGVHCDDFCSTLLRRLQRREHARVICPRILAENKNRISMRKILQLHTGFADPNHRRQRHAGRLMAHIRTIGQVVRAESAHEKLI